MTYTKPELVRLGSAIAAVQNQTDKSEQEAPDADSLNPNPASILAYAVGLTSDFSIHTHPRCAHARPKPSLKMRLICLAGILGLVGTTIHQPTSVDTYFSTELPIAKAGLLANIGSDGVKSSGAKVCVGIAQDTART